MTNINNTSKSSTPKLPSNFQALTFSAACPSCGSTVEFASAGSVMAVCDYCQTTVLRDGDAIKSQGKQSLTIEDYSPLQVGSVGRFDDVDFVLIGRIQLNYEQGVWSEWYIQFADGRNGWLSEALGLYSLTIGKGTQSNLPAYTALAINDTVTFDSIVYRVTDRRTAHAVAGEGELPFIVDEGWQTWSIDAQFMRNFITLDYSDMGASHAPVVYQGHAVELDDLDMQMLKDDRQINEQAGRAGIDEFDLDYDAEVDSTSAILINKVECPNCGSPIPYVEGKTDFLICPSCHSESKLSGSQAELFQIHSAMKHYDTSLPLGAKARILASDIAGVDEFSQKNNPLHQTAIDELNSINNQKYHDYVVIGIMRLNEVGEDANWTEYLLYSLTDGFLWLSEESSGWFVSRVLNEMPVLEGSHLVYDNRAWQRVDLGYYSQVIFAIGAFNWQVKINDSNKLIDYINGDEVISSEQTDKEITYTHAKPLEFSKLKEWFGVYLTIDKPRYTGGEGSLKKMLTWHGGLQLVVLILSGGSLVIAIVVAILIFITYFKASSSSDEGSSSPFSYHSSGVQLLSIVLVVIGLIMSLIIGAAPSSSTTGSNATSGGGGGFIFLPSGGSSSGRTGYSSGGSHK